VKALQQPALVLSLVVVRLPVRESVIMPCNVCADLPAFCRCCPLLLLLLLLLLSG
jgi:hypothetical protein